MKRNAINRKSRSPSLPVSEWSVREWGSFASIVGTVILVWMTFGPRRNSAQLTEGNG